MTISGYSNAIVDVMLGWLKGLANWVLRLFNLAGAVSTSPLLWLSRNWLKLLIFFLALGVILDRLIWLIRWRPYWVWFRKERVIVNDDRFFKRADLDIADDWENDLRDNWDEHDYVVASTVVKSRRRNADKGAETRPSAEPGRRRVKGTKVQRHVGGQGQAQPKRGGTPSARDDAQTEKKDATEAARRRVSQDSIFAIDLEKPDASDFYEDEVFNVTNLPVFDDFSSDGQD